ncbi:MAG TPA: hypothetical protein VJ550_13195 [Geomonas sp.]|nr:hypothetical protein [Geomonas sp.]
MPKRFFASLICGACAIAAFTSCGSEKAGGTGEFATVFATANSPGADVNSDVATWVDSTGAKATACGASSIATVTPDTATYTVTSTAYSVANTGSSSSSTSSTTTTSDLIIDKITLILTPANTTSPALPAIYQTQYLTAGQRVAAGSTVNIPVVIASNQLKTYLGTGLGSASIDCNPASPTYTYRATVSFEALEVNTNRVATITAPGFLLVNFADYIDK